MMAVAEEKEKGVTKSQIYHTNKGRTSAPERSLWISQGYYFPKCQQKRRENAINQASYKIKTIAAIYVSC